MIKNKKLLIDRDCPMCRIYGNAFTQLKWVDQETVSYYQSCPNKYAENIDMQRAKSEIAFFNPVSGKTKYGIDAFIEILWEGRLSKLLRWKPLYWISKKFYRFVSFNRKVIAPARKSGISKNCEPPLHPGYRIVYIVFSILFFSLGLDILFSSLQSEFSLIGSTSPLFLAVLPFSVQSLALFVSQAKNKLDYLGNMATVANILTIILLPAVLVFQLLNLSVVYMLIATSLAATIAFVEIRDRTKLLNQSDSLNLSWFASHLITLLIPFSI
jgi:hypothetical protein